VFKLSKEAKLGLLVIVTIFFSIWGYKYIKGKDLFSKTIEIKAIFSDVTGLEISSPVFINGYKIGSVTGIDINKAKVDEMIVNISIEKDFNIPNDAIAIMYDDGIVGGKNIKIEFSQLCNGNNCIVNGDVLKAKSEGLLTSMLGTDNVNEYIETAGNKLSETIDHLGDADKNGALHETLRNLNLSLANIASMTSSLNKVLVNNSQNMNSMMKNMDKMMGNIADNNENISQILTNLNTITADFGNANIGSNTATTLENAKLATTQLNTTLANTEKAMNNLNSILAKMDAGDGSLSKLLNDKKLYDNLEFTSKNLALLLQDLRINPGRYVNISVFGKKKKDYILPENDPAFQDTLR